MLPRRRPGFGSKTGRGYQALDGRDVPEHDCSLVALDPTVFTPALLDFIDALASPARHIAELLLGDVKLHWRTRNAGQRSSMSEVQQHFRNSRFQVAEKHVL